MSKVDRKQGLIAEAVAELRQAGADVDLLDAAASVRLGLNRTDLRVMEMLDRVGSLTAGELAAATRMSNAGLTSVIDRLVQKGYAIRQYDPVDRRRVAVELTERAKNRSEEAFSSHMGALFKLLEQYQDNELAMIVSFLQAWRGTIRDLVETLERTSYEAPASPEHDSPSRPSRPAGPV